MKQTGSTNLDYQSAGVDITAGNRAVELIKDEAASTFDKHVLAKIGSFASMYDLSWISGTYRNPVLVQSVDGVGTKISIARMANDYSTIGQDLFNACTNDIAVHGAKPLTFLDYIANDILEPEIVAAIVKGLAVACRESSVSLVGGETAEMPGVYLPGEHDLVGLVTGIVERDAIVTGKSVQDGDVILAVGSSGLHTNGYSLARKVLFAHAGLRVTDPLPGTEGTSVGKALLAPHVNYSNGIEALLATGAPVRSMAHITGGGLIENVPRVIPKGLRPRFHPQAWTRMPIFEAIQRLGNVSDHEMYRTFNMGIGLTVVVPASEAQTVLAQMRQIFSQPVWEVGSIGRGVEGTWIEGVRP
ncbi:MAG: phosphoribosylformylglycinamidine cyclo-ligase [Spirochaetes bacterium GWC2_52_13]|nr:MAG: phosphoribosylformylglycinamidine cyclo-ligase [Spirochaetes bacterium GWC2_52_13]HCG63769.1 phosphoribosylformylglycinamidine cyclo-ligase [Sphaerochaeta sp.]